MKTINLAYMFILIFISLVSCQTKKTASNIQNANIPNPLSSDQIFQKTEDNIFDGTVHQLTINLDGDTWRHVTAHKDSPERGNACREDAPYGHIKKLEFINSKTGEKTTIHNAGIRIKGNTILR